ncbi:MAG: HAD family hydrolase [Anaerolineae bacterium]|nr:HAD family hydrolase [Anaerolineae bacterium]
MTSRKTWLVDFDETLASGSITWAFQNTFPKFIREYNLQTDPARLREVMLELQERASRDPDPAPLLDDLFTTMGWRPELKQPLLKDVLSSYQPTLFDDTLPFLRALRNNDQRILVVSNNPRTPDQAHLLGIEPLVDRVVTPWTYPDALPKPHRSLWDQLIIQETRIDPQTAVVVGDDPWSDGEFAEACGLSCWIVDRLNRFEELCAQRQYLRVQKLLDITL